MGVLGLTTLLQQYGWMPKRQGCVTSLWRDVSLDEEDTMAPLEVLSTNSTLAVDGNGLAHYLHEVAYARHFSQVTAYDDSKKKNGKPGNCTCKKELTQEQVIQCLPQSMPLTVLDQVTREFIDSLHKHHLKLVIYWDGDGRRMKAATSKKRRQGRSDEWSNLYQYCQFGTLPFRSPCLRNFSNSFPDSRLLMQQVVVTLSSYHTVEQIYCDEEADREVAMASAHNPGTYCVGMDSDYCLFPDTKYVPFSTLNASGSNVTGCVITREGLADLFQLPSSESMVEMGILMGNDYVGSAKEAGLDYFAGTAEEAIDHLQLRGDDYQVQCRSEEVQLALDFTRALYSFESLEDFPMDDTRPDLNSSAYSAGNDGNRNEEQDLSPGDRPELPASFDLTLGRLKPLDFSLREVVERPMKAYITDSTDDFPIMTKQHLDTFHKLNKALENGVNKRTVTKDRPNWRDVLAAYAIEKCISHVLRSSVGSPVVRYALPMKMFDQLSFECMMNAQREASKPAVVAPVPPIAVVEISKAGPEERVRLPIDEFEVDILDSIATHRVTIIHGKTGCGKSSRVPVMVLRAPMPDNSLTDVKMFISQPRRIAAKSLVERVRSCEPDIKHKIALRMGHGEREYESSQTRAWFVTTGYLVRLLANHPEKFNDVSHLIIDEVHERSVDSDVLCLLCRRLLATNSKIRLVLMSATLAANMYADYFGVTEPPIEVGGRRFPIREYFVEDLMSTFKLPAKDKKSAKTIQDQCEKSKCRAPPSNSYMENLYNLAVSVTVAVGQPGSSVLIFVTGMNDIISIIDRIEKQYKPGVRYTCFPIHSDVPFEEQMAAFDKPEADEIKVVIGTNAAESSITLPDVDHVVCLGLQKQIIYNAASHRQLLTPAWISRSNAVQRAGRTGRVRIGNVYRLYTKRALDDYMLKFELGEMSRVPLDSVILNLKQMLNEEATPVLLDCLEPPDLLTIERSFESLHSQQFLSEADDSGHITNLGSFVSSLGIDLMLGSLIGLGIQFGVGPEALEMAAILSFAKTPWIISSPMFHDPLEFNDLTARTFASRCHFDACLYSDPLAVMNMLWDYEKVSNKKGFGWQFSLALSRVRRLLSTRNSIRNRVANFVGCDVASVTMQDPPSRMSHSKVVLLRIIQVWVFSDNLIQSYQAANVGAGDHSMTVTLRKNPVETEQLKQILDEERHSFKLVTHRETEQKGKFTPIEEGFDFSAFLPSFEERYISYCAEQEFKMAWYRVDSDLFVLLVRDMVASSTSVNQMKEEALSGFDESFVVALPRPESNNRGRNGRACGLWSIEHVDQDTWDVSGDGVRFVRFASNEPQKINKIAKFLKIKSLQTSHVDKTLSCHIFFQKASKKKNRTTSPGFSLFTRGQALQLTKQDVTDLFASGKLEMISRESSKPTQEVQFKMGHSGPMKYKGNNSNELSGGSTNSLSSWKQPLLKDIPEGARIMSVLASCRRPEHYISFSSIEKEEGEDDDKLTKVELSRSETRIPDRWSNFATGRSVYVEVNGVPSASLCLDGPVDVFAIAGDSLELKGGALRVMGLTLLPPGRLFLLLCMKTFGLHPVSLSYDDEDEELDQCLGWLDSDLGMSNTEGSAEDAADRVLRAIEFHESCKNLGENLQCYPELVQKILSIFDSVDGYPCSPWDELYQRGETVADGNVSKRKQNSSRRKKGSSNGNSLMTIQPPNRATPLKADPPAESNLGNSKKKQGNTQPKGNPQAPSASHFPQELATNKNEPQSEDRNQRVHAVLVSRFNKKAKKKAVPLFALTMEDSDVKEAELPSSNILSMLVDRCNAEAKLSGKTEANAATSVPDQWAVYGKIAKDEVVRLNEPVTFVPTQWQVYRVPGKNGRDWFSATFIGSQISVLPLEGRRNIPAWMKLDVPRPSKAKDSKQCVPPHFAPRLTFWQTKVSIEETSGEEEEMLLFPDLETAIRMGAAYWLERQFFDGQRHWYEVPFGTMVELSTAKKIDTAAPQAS